MDKFKQAILAAISLLLLCPVLSVKADESVWYCKTTQNVAVFTDSVGKESSERFKLKVTPTQVQFGKNGFSSEHPIPMTAFNSDVNWVAVGGMGIATFDRGSLSYVIMHPRAVIAVLASCEQF